MSAVAAVLAAIAADAEHLPILDESRAAVLSREEAAEATETAATLGTVALAVPVPGTPGALRVYVREGACMVSFASPERRDVEAAIEAARRLARERAEAAA